MSSTQEEEPELLCSDAYAELVWQRADGLWVGLYGQGERYGQVDALITIGESIVDRPQPVQLQFELSPEGWVVSGYESLSNLSLVDRADPTSVTDRISVSVSESRAEYRDPVESLAGMADGNPVEEVAVQGGPAALMSIPDHFADPDSGRRMWSLRARFADGPQFLLQAPDTLTRDDVLAMAEGLSTRPDAGHRRPLTSRWRTTAPRPAIGAGPGRISLQKAAGQVDESGGRVGRLPGAGASARGCWTGTSNRRKAGGCIG